MIERLLRDESVRPDSHPYVTTNAGVCDALFDAEARFPVQRTADRVRSFAEYPEAYYGQPAASVGVGR